MALGDNVSKEVLGPEAGKEVLLVSQQDLDKVIAQVTIDQQQLQAKTLEHLVAKLLNTSDNKQLHMSLMSEGAVGLWELLSGVTAVGSLITGASLRGLMEALRKPILSVELQLPAICSAWHVCAAAKPRERLVQLGVVQVLLQIAGSAWSRLQLGTAIASTAADAADGQPDRAWAVPYPHVAVLSASLGALGVLAIDSTAREQIMINRQSVKLLVDVATTAAGTYRQQISDKAGLCLVLATDSALLPPGQQTGAAAPAALGVRLTEQHADVTTGSADTGACANSHTQIPLPMALLELSSQEVSGTA
eukprot:gene4532-4784_t